MGKKKVLTRTEALVLACRDGALVRPIGLKLVFYYDATALMPFKMRLEDGSVEDWDWNWVYEDWETIEK